MQRHSLQKLTPNVLEADSCISLAFEIPNRPLLAFDKSSTRVSVSMDNMASGVGYLDRISLEVTPKVSEKSLEYSGKT